MAVVATAALIPENSTEIRNDHRLKALLWAKKGRNVVPRKAIDKKHPSVKWKDPAPVRLSERRPGWRVRDLLEHLSKRAESAA